MTASRGCIALAVLSLTIGCSLAHETAPVDAAPASPDAAALDAAALDAFVPPMDAGASDAFVRDAFALDAYAPDVPMRPDSGVHEPVPIACGRTAAVSYGIDPAHRASQPSDVLRLPLAPRWTADLGRVPSYPLVACGLVFLTLHDEPAVAPSTVVALDATTGAIAWGPIDLAEDPRGGGVAGPAYADGHLLVVETHGTVSSFDAGHGGLEWRTTIPDALDVPNAPVADHGVLVIGTSTSFQRVHAVDVATGAPRWSVDLYGAPSILIDETRVLTFGGDVRALEPASGDLLWTGLVPALGEPAMEHAGRAYVMGSPGHVIDVLTGAELGTAFSEVPFAADGSTRYRTLRRQLFAVDDGEATALWSFEAPDAILWGPVVVGEHVVVVSRSTLSIVDRATGALVQAIPSPARAGGFGAGLAGPALAAADGIVLVPTATGLVAY